MVSYDKLGNDQHAVIDEIGRLGARPIWVKGHAGSGKSIVLLHSLSDYLIKKPNALVCVVGYTRSLVQLLNTGIKEIPALKERTIQVYTANGVIVAIKDGKKYDAIFCDEVQDLPIEHIQLMKQSCTHLVLAGDPNQSIYTSIPLDALSPVSMKPLIEADFISRFTPVEKSLSVIYRLKRNILQLIRNGINSFLVDMNVAGSDNVDVSLVKASSIESEISYTWQKAKEDNVLRRDKTFAFLFYGKGDLLKYINEVLSIENKPRWEVKYDRFENPNYNDLNWHLEQNEIPIMVLSNGAGNLDVLARKNKIAFITYHSAKGLDFNYVFLPMIGESLSFREGDPIQSIILVALSRSSGGLAISYTGEMNEHFKPFLSSLTAFDIDSSNQEEDDDVLF